MAGTLHLTLSGQPGIGDMISINAKYLNNTGTYSFISFTLYFVEKRLRQGQVTLGATVRETAINYISAFNLDFRNTGGDNNLRAFIAISDISETKIDIVLENPNWLFEGVSGGTAFLEYLIDNAPVEARKSVKFTGYDYETSTCSNLVALFDLSGGSGSYNAYLNGDLAVTGASPLSLGLSRDSVKHNLSFTDSLGADIGSILFRPPQRISSDKINIPVAYTEHGAVITVNVAFISEYILPLTYSLDGVNYGEENIFTGQADGDYTIYVKDAFGCVTSKNITIDGVSTITEINFEISDINPIRYAIVESGKKNRYNTLSHEQLKNVPYPYIQYFTAADSPITQFKTNAKYINAFALDCNGSMTPLIPVKRSNHIGQTLKTTATKFSTEDNLMGIYFGVADVVDPLSGDILESKDYGYQVPYAFNKVGRFVTLEGIGTIPIKDIVYDEAYEAFILVFDMAYTGAETATSVLTTYNIQNYEIYEFVTDISEMPESFNVVIEAGLSADDVSFTYISELIEQTVDSDNLAEIIYWNTENTGGMNYATGVVHTLRLHSILSRLSDTQTVDGYNGDTERYNTNHGIFDGEEFIFTYLSEEMVRKLRLVLTHDRLFINGVHYTLGEEAPELNSRFTTNICELTAVLRKGGDLTESFDREIIEPATGEGVDRSAYELEQAISAARGKALILWKKS